MVKKMRLTKRPSEKSKRVKIVSYKPSGVLSKLQSHRMTIHLGGAKERNE